MLLLLLFGTGNLLATDDQLFQAYAGLVCFSFFQQPDLPPLEKFDVLGQDMSALNIRSCIESFDSSNPIITNAFAPKVSLHTYPEAQSHQLREMPQSITTIITLHQKIIDFLTSDAQIFSPYDLHQKISIFFRYSKKVITAYNGFFFDVTRQALTNIRPTGTEKELCDHFKDRLLEELEKRQAAFMAYQKPDIKLSESDFSAIEAEKAALEIDINKILPIDVLGFFFEVLREAGQCCGSDQDQLNRNLDTAKAKMDERFKKLEAGSWEPDYYLKGKLLMRAQLKQANAIVPQQAPAPESHAVTTAQEQAEARNVLAQQNTTARQNLTTAEGQARQSLATQEEQLRRTVATAQEQAYNTLVLGQQETQETAARQNLVTAEDQERNALALALTQAQAYESPLNAMQKYINDGNFQDAFDILSDDFSNRALEAAKKNNRKEATVRAGINAARDYVNKQQTKTTMINALNIRTNKINRSLQFETGEAILTHLVTQTPQASN